MDLKYVIAGSGATGGSIGAFLAADGQDVTFLARGAQLAALKEKGISMRHTAKGNFSVCPVKAMTMEEYQEMPDVIFVCVKNYSLEDAVTFAARTGSAETVVIPILNIYGTGERMQKRLPSLTVTDGCIYVAAHVSAPGEITHGGDIFRVVYGLRPGQKPGSAVLAKLNQVKARISGVIPLKNSCIQARWLRRENIFTLRREIFKKRESPERLLSPWTGNCSGWQLPWGFMCRTIWWRSIWIFWQA